MHRSGPKAHRSPRRASVLARQSPVHGVPTHAKRFGQARDRLAIGVAAGNFGLLLGRQSPRPAYMLTTLPPPTCRARPSLPPRFPLQHAQGRQHADNHMANRRAGVEILAQRPQRQTPVANVDERLQHLSGERPSRSMPTTTRMSPARASSSNAAIADRESRPMPSSSSVYTRSTSTPARSSASCCTDAGCPRETRAYPSSRETLTIHRH